MSVSWPVQQGIYTAFLGLGFLAVSVPAYWQLRAWNVGAVLLIFWCATGCLVQFIDTIVWYHDFTNHAPAWCDIVTRLLQAQPVGVAVASALVNFRMYSLAKSGAKSGKSWAGPSDVRKVALVDAAIGLGTTSLFMITYWFTQERRYDIFEGLGCYPAPRFTIVWLFSYAIWPTVISLISATFCVMNLTTYMQDRQTVVNSILSLSSTCPALTPGRHLRTSLLGFASVAFLLPFNIVVVALALRAPLASTLSLDNLHSSLGFFHQLPLAVWQASPGLVAHTLVPPGGAIPLAFLCLGFFGVGVETIEGYTKALDALKRSIGNWRKPRKAEITAPTPFTLNFPSSIQRVPTAHRPKRRQRMLSSSLSVCVTVEGLTVYDDLPPGLSGTSLTSLRERSFPSTLKSVDTARPVLCEVSPAESQAACIFGGITPLTSSPTSPDGKMMAGRRPVTSPGLAAPVLTMETRKVVSPMTPPAHPFYGPQSAVCSSDSLV